MPTSFEATRLNLEYFRKQAKALLKNAQAGDRDALVRLKTVRTNSAPPALHDAQLAIARVSQAGRGCAGLFGNRSWIFRV
jgi:hypothetical protein